MAITFGPHPERGEEFPELISRPRAGVGPGLLLVGAALILPLLTWLRLGEMLLVNAATETPLFLMTVVGLLALGTNLFAEDGWLGLFVVYVALNAVAREANTALVVAWWITLAALGLVFLRRLPAAWDLGLRWLLIAAGLVQGAYGLLQWLGADPIYRLADPRFETTVRGFLGHSTWLGSYLAISGALAPWYLLPAFGLCLLATGSIGGLTALAGALAWRYRARHGLIVGLLAAPWLALWMLYSHSLDTVVNRWTVWKGGLAAWLGGGGERILLGFGPGSWHNGFARLEWQTGGMGTPAGRYREWYLQAHNEYLQAGFELGLIGLLIILGWLWWNRGLFADPIYGPGAAAAALACLWTFPLHLAALVLLVMVIVGRALGRRPAEPAGSWRYSE